MFTYFELSYLMLYLFSFYGFFNYMFNKLYEFENQRKLISGVEKYISVLEDNIFCDLVDNIDNYYDLNTEIDKIIVYAEDTEISKCMLMVLFELFPNTKKIAIGLSDDNFEIIKLCDELDFEYFNKSEEYSGSNCKNEEEFMINYSKLCNVKYCFMNFENNDMMDLIFDNIFNNNFTLNINTLEHKNIDNVNIYNIFCKPELFLNFVNIWDHYFNNLNNTYIHNYYYHQDLVNENWRTNMMLTYQQLKRDDNKLSNKVSSLFNSKTYEYGIIVNVDRDNLPYWLWENIFNQITDNYNLEVEKQVIQTLYFTITQDKKDDGEILLDWRYNYNNGVFILYNHTELQEILYNCDISDLSESDIMNSTESFMNGNIIYQVLQLSDEDYLSSNDILLNLEDTTNEELFRNFNFKKFDLNTIVCNSV